MYSKGKLLVNYDKIVLLSSKKYSKKGYIYTVNTFIFYICIFILLLILVIQVIF